MKEAFNHDRRGGGSRPTVPPFHSVEIQIPTLFALYHFRLWNISSKGMCLLVRDDSKVLSHIAVGDVMEMRYFSSEDREPPEKLNTRVRHITKENQGRYRGHHLVGLEIMECDK